MEKSPLRRIAPELRNKIYEYVFATTQVDLEAFNQGGALLHVCSQLRREARLVLFANARIVMKGDHAKAALARKENSRTVIRKLAVKLVNAFGMDAMKVVANSRIRIFSNAEQINFHSPNKLYLWMGCDLCTPWLSRGGMVDPEEAAAAKEEDGGAGAKKTVALQD